MQHPEPASFDQLLGGCQASAIHLEMRDIYGIAEEDERIAKWRAGYRPDPADRASWWDSWYELIATAVGRGVEIRRARVVSEPLSEYIRYEHSGTWKNIAAGEAVRWLPRSQASDLLLPGNDFWVFDNCLVRFGLFAGDGTHVRNELIDDAIIVQACAKAFEAVWSRAIPHEDYTVEDR